MRTEEENSFQLILLESSTNIIIFSNKIQFNENQ